MLLIIIISMMHWYAVATNQVSIMSDKYTGAKCLPLCLDLEKASVPCPFMSRMCLSRLLVCKGLNASIFLSGHERLIGL